MITPTPSQSLTQDPSACPHLGVWSDPWLPDVGPDGTPVGAPLSDGGPTPHFPSDSNGSSTCTPPSLRPNANWLGSTGWAAMTNGYTVELASRETTKVSDDTSALLLTLPSESPSSGGFVQTMSEQDTLH